MRNERVARATASVALLLVTSCDDPSEAPHLDPVRCEAPSRIVASGKCVEPGVQDDGCAAGTLFDGTECVAAGIPPAACGEGFVAVGEGCEPVLPPGPCPFGSMAIPGETVCRPVKACAPGRWGDLPVDGATQYVDAAHSGDSDGTADKPWTTIQDALDAAAPGALVAVAAGDYSECGVTVDKPLSIGGACPEAVRIACPNDSAIIFANVVGAELFGITFHDVLYAATAGPGADVVVRDIWIHDAEIGVFAWGGGRLVLQNALAEASGAAVLANGGEVDVDGCHFRDADLDTTYTAHAVLALMQDGQGPSKVRLGRVLIERTDGIGLAGSDLVVDASVVRESVVDDSSNTKYPDAAIYAQPDLEQTRLPSVQVDRSIIDGARGIGVWLIDADATLAHTTVRGVVAGANGLDGHGVRAWGGSTELRHAIVEDTTSAGVTTMGAGVSLFGSIVRRTAPRPGDLHGGFGVVASVIDSAIADFPASSVVSLHGSRVEDNHDVGVLAVGSEVVVDGTVVARTLPRPADQGGGRGVVAQSDADVGLPATLDLRASSIEDHHELGVGLFEADAVLVGSIVRGVGPGDLDPIGDGVAAVAGALPTTVFAHGLAVHDSARAGLSAFGAWLTVGATSLHCQSHDVVVQPSAAAATLAYVEFAGELTCGCDSAESSCAFTDAGQAEPARTE